MNESISQEESCENFHYINKISNSKKWWSDFQNDLLIGWQTSLSPGIYCDCCSHIFSQSSIVYRCMQCKVHNMCDNCAKTIHNFPPMALHPLQQWCCEKSLFLPSDLLQVTPTLTCQHYYNGNKHQYFDSRLVNLLGYCNKKISAKHNIDFLTSSICCSCY